MECQLRQMGGWSSVGSTLAVATSGRRLEPLDHLGCLCLGQIVRYVLTGLTGERLHIAGLGAGHRLITGDPVLCRFLRWAITHTVSVPMFEWVSCTEYSRWAATVR